MEMKTFHPIKGRIASEVKGLLQECGLSWDDSCESTVAIVEDDMLLATGSRHGNTLKCIGAARDRQGEGLIAMVVTALVKDAYLCGHEHLFLFTKPGNQPLFSQLGFYPIASTDDVVFMENIRGGIDRFVSSLQSPRPAGTVGAIIANCNPFTLGHQYLIEAAALACDCVHVFILSEEKSDFSAEVRTQLAKDGTAHLPNVIVHPTGPYLISSATFPDYFLKDRADAQSINCALDLTVFAQRIAKPMGITRRFVGTEPVCRVTSQYNEQMKQLLPALGVEVVEIPRCQISGIPVSASYIRRMLAAGSLPEVRAYLPATTYTYLMEVYGHES